MNMTIREVVEGVALVLLWLTVLDIAVLANVGSWYAATYLIMEVKNNMRRG